MADEKVLKTRIVNKHDTEANWLKATTFVPKAGELILYDPDSTHDYTRIKIGDGSLKVSALPFLLDKPGITIVNGTPTTPTGDTVAVISGETASGHTITNTKVNVATKDYVDRKSVAAVQYLGTVSNANELAALNPNSVGDFCRVAAAFSSYHAGDLLLCKTLKTSSASATWDVIHGEIDKDTWTANSKSAAGYVAAGGTNANKVWKTDASGNPAWRDDANTDTNTAHTHTVGTGLNIDGSGGISGTTKYSLKVASSSEIGGVKPGTTSGKTYGVAVASDGTMTVSVPWTDTNTDTKVTQTVTTSNAAYPLLLAPSGQTATQTTTAYFDSGVTLNPSTNTISANVSGNAGTTTKLATARTITLSGDVSGSTTFDGSGNVTITTTVADDSHNHIISNVDGLQSALNYRLTYNDVLQTTNPFGGKHLYISKIDNALYCADKRWTVTGSWKGSSSGTYSASELRSLFDGSYESQFTVTKGNTATIRITFNTNESHIYNSQKCFPGYPYGYVYLSYYYTNTPIAHSKLRVYCNYEPHTIGVHEFQMSSYVGSYPLAGATEGNSGLVEYVRQPNYAISYMEFEITAPSTYSVGITQIEFNLDRPDSSRTPFLSKYSPEKLYYPLTAPEFIGNASTATKATQDGNGNVITSTYATKSHKHSVTAAGTIGNTSITPAGTVSQPTFTGTAASHNHTFTGTAAEHTHTFTGTQATASVKYTPAGTVSQPTFTGTAHNHTFSGSSVTSGKPDTTNVTTIYSITGVGSLPSASLSSGTLPSCSYTAPSLTASVSNQCLTLSLSGGSHSFNAGAFPTLNFNAGSLPTREAVSLPNANHTHAVTAAGTVGSATAGGTVSKPTFTGTEATISHTFTPAGSISKTSVTPAGTISSKKLTPAGTVSKPTFTGTAASHTHTFTGSAVNSATES